MLMFWLCNHHYSFVLVLLIMELYDFDLASFTEKAHPLQRLKQIRFLAGNTQWKFFKYLGKNVKKTPKKNPRYFCTKYEKVQITIEIIGQ